MLLGYEFLAKFCNFTFLFELGLYFDDLHLKENLWKEMMIIVLGLKYIYTYMNFWEKFE